MSAMSAGEQGVDSLMRPRFELIWADVTKYRLGPLCTNAATYTPLPFSHLSHPTGFALVLLDGHALRNTAGPSLSALHTLADRLLISQLIIAFDVIRAGGTIVMKLNDIRNPTTKRLLYLFDALAADVRTWKPVCIHATRPTFYVIARGIRCGPSAHSFGSVQEELQGLWARLTMGQSMDGDSLNFIVDGHTLKTTYARRLSELTNHIRVVQAQASEGQRKQVAMGF